MRNSIILRPGQTIAVATCALLTVLTSLAQPSTAAERLPIHSPRELTMPQLDIGSLPGARRFATPRSPPAPVRVTPAILEESESQKSTRNLLNKARFEDYLKLDKASLDSFCPSCHTNGGIDIFLGKEILERIPPSTPIYLCSYPRGETQEPLQILLEKGKTGCAPLNAETKKEVPEHSARCAAKQDLFATKNVLLVTEKLFVICPQHFGGSLGLIREGFRETLYMRHHRAGAADYPCTGVLVGPNAALTAFHCVFYKSKDNNWKDIKGPSRAILATPGSANSNTLRSTLCPPALGNPGNCTGYQTKEIFQVDISEKKSGEIQNGSVPTPDWALVKVEFVGVPAALWPVPAKLVSVENYNSVTDRITQMGWGISNRAPNPDSPPRLDGGHPKFLPKTADFTDPNAPHPGWTRLMHADSDSVRSCDADSGSPVFKGIHNGNPTNAPRELIGLVSGGGNTSGNDSTGPTAAECKKLDWQGIQFITPAILTDICSAARVANLTVNGCPTS